VHNCELWCEPITAGRWARCSIWTWCRCARKWYWYPFTRFIWFGTNMRAIHRASPGVCSPSYLHFRMAAYTPCRDVTLPDATTYQETLTFHCDSGFELTSGDMQAVCSADGTVSGFRQNFTLKNAIGSHAGSLQRQWHSSRVATFLPVHTVNCVKTLKVLGTPLPTVCARRSNAPILPLQQTANGSSHIR
jgi:hypothetical protein